MERNLQLQLFYMLTQNTARAEMSLKLLLSLGTVSLILFPSLVGSTGMVVKKQTAECHPRIWRKINPENVGPYL